MTHRTTILALLVLLTLPTAATAAVAPAPPALPGPEPACHDNDCNSNAVTSCDVTVCITVSVGIFVGDCAYKPIGTPCTAILYADARAEAAAGGVATLADSYGRADACTVPLAGSCSMRLYDLHVPTYRGAIVCYSATGTVTDGLFSARATSADCTEAH